jgi:hypothetical protein
MKQRVSGTEAHMVNINIFKELEIQELQLQLFCVFCLVKRYFA